MHIQIGKITFIFIYTSQSCPSCYYVDRKNRNSRQDDFRCLHCGLLRHSKRGR